MKTIVDRNNLAPTVNGKTLREQRHMGVCNCCGTWLPFPGSKTGELVNCPTCLMETVLALPNAPRTYAIEKWTPEVQEIRWGATDLGFRCIEGRLVNRSPSDLDWARIEFTLFNGMGVSVGTTMDSILGFRSGMVWSFRAPVFNDEVVRASFPSFSTEFGRISPEELIPFSAGVPLPGTESPSRSDPYGLERFEFERRDRYTDPRRQRPERRSVEADSMGRRY